MNCLRYFLLIFWVTGCSQPEKPSPKVSVEPIAAKVTGIPLRLFEDEDLVTARSKVKNLIQSGNAMWFLHGEATDNPAFCFLVRRRDWKLFSLKERMAMRPIITEQMEDLFANPAKYTVCKEGAPLWSFVLQKISRAYPSVILSDHKNGLRDFELSEKIDDLSSGSR